MNAMISNYFKYRYQVQWCHQCVRHGWSKSSQRWERSVRRIFRTFLLFFFNVVLTFILKFCLWLFGFFLGCMVIKPWGMGVWDLLRAELDDRSALLQLQLEVFSIELLFIYLRYYCGGNFTLKHWKIWLHITIIRFLFCGMNTRCIMLRPVGMCWTRQIRMHERTYIIFSRTYDLVCTIGDVSNFSTIFQNETKPKI